MNCTGRNSVSRRAAISALVVLLIAGAIGGLSGVAHAAVHARVPASFCGTAKKLGEDVFTPQAASSGKITLKKIKRAVEQLAKAAPSSLKPSFKTLREFYDTYLSNLDNPQKLAEAGRNATKATEAGEKISAYLKTKCKLGVE